MRYSTQVKSISDLKAHAAEMLQTLIAGSRRSLESLLERSPLGR